MSEPVAEVKESKSIVPSRYANKYKGGGAGPTSNFIKEECEVDGGFSFDQFFELCEANGITEEKINEYRGKLATHGVPGRARMTLGNMLRSIARKNQALVNLDGKKVDVAEPALPKAEKLKEAAE